MIPLFAKAMHYDGGEYGEGILLKHIFLSTRNLALPYSPGNEPHSALEIACTLNSNDTIAFIGTHLYHLEDETDRLAQTNKINERFKANAYSKAKCGKAIQRSEHQDLIDKNRQRVNQNQSYYKRRQAIVEHPYGTIKRQWGFNHIMTKKRH